ncbi:ataxin-7-like protein 2b [Hoplias malabaricus]|uniref:ataxin-7-like protein 2b n=1 Tax=Hoplias malabaricus TaxID=27720 RepID=UPI00346313C6
MAAPDRRIYILSEFVEQSWNIWRGKADVSTAEGTLGEESSKNVKKRMETMTLRKEDMCIYGHCPSQDEFYLVVCSHCGQVVKPQAFEKHCEQRHGPLSKLFGSHCPLSSPSHWPQQGRPPSQHESLNEGRDIKQQGAGPPRYPPLHSPSHKMPKAQKDGTGISPLDDFSHMNPPSPPFFLCTPTPQDPPWPPGSTPPRKTFPSVKPLQKGTDVHKPPPGPRTYSRTYKKVAEKECDLDKHCGVLDPERNKLCTRLLTCNIHSIHQRRQVVGRSKSFNQLLLETKMRSTSWKRAPCLIRNVAEDVSLCPQTSAGQPQPCRQQTPNNVSLRTPSESGIDEEEQKLCSDERGSVPGQCAPHLSASLSSEESDGENQEASTDLPPSTCHPKPLGMCTFGARSLGCCVVVFDRRLLHLRSVFSTMVEHHLSAHLKSPQVSEMYSYRIPSAFTLASQSHNALRRPPSRVPTPSASSYRTSTSSVPRCPPGDTSTSGQSEPRASNTVPPSKTQTKTPEASGPSQPQNSVGRINKPTQQPGLGQLQDGPKARQRKKSSTQEDSLGHYRSFSCPKDKQPSTIKPSLSMSDRQINGIFSPSSKPRSQLHIPEMQGLAKRSLTPHTSPPSPPESSSSDGGGASGLHRKHKGPSQKRKTSDASSLEPPSRLPKPNSLLHPPSSLFSWSRDSKAKPVSLSVEKKLDVQKPKLHH